VRLDDLSAPPIASLPFEPEACLFDLDGTLVDSEPLFEYSEELLLGSWGMTVDDELRREIFGRSAVSFFEIVERRFPANAINLTPLSERLAAKTKFFLETAHGRIATFPPIEKLARSLAVAGIPLAIASSSNHEIIDFELDETGLSGLFPVRVSAVDVAKGKPEPDVFLEAARRLGAEPHRCVVFEDSVFGLIAARAAGAFAISLPAPGAELARFSSADLLLPGGPALANAARLLDFLAIGPSRGRLSEGRQLSTPTTPSE